MDAGNQLDVISSRLDEILEEEPGYFRVQVSVKPVNNIKVYVDADHGAAIDRLSKINRAMYRWMEEHLFPDGNFSLEVSSPGLDEPLKMDRQYIKNIGRHVEVLQTDGMIKAGELISVNDEEIILKEIRGKGRKIETFEHRILKQYIKTTKIQIKI